MDINKDTEIKLNILKVVDAAKKSIENRRKKLVENEGFQDECALIEMLLTKGYDLPYSEYAELINDKYKRNLNREDVIDILKKIFLFNYDTRAELCSWANRVVVFFSKALVGDLKSFYELKKLMDNHKYYEKIYPNFYNKLVLIGIYNKNTEFKDKNDNKKIIYNFGNTWASYHLNEILDSLIETYRYPRNRRRYNYRRNNRKINRKEIELLEDKLSFTTDKLKRTEGMLNDLQEEFDKLLEDSKNLERIKFFSKLNSKDYGNILDQLIKNNRGVNKLRREKVDLPIELNGVLIIFKNLLKFIKDSEIEPMLKPGLIKEVDYKDIENYEYEGSPFIKDELKKVKVVSPGWIYKKENIQIARPIVQEVLEEEVE